MTHAGRIKTGTGVYAKHLLAALKKDGSLSTILLAQPQGLARSADIVEKLTRGLRQIWWTQFGLSREARASSADLLHAPAFVSSLFLSCPLVVTVHDLAYLRYPECYSRSWLLYLRLLVPAVVRRAQAVLADSHCTKEDIVRYLGTPPQKVRVVHLGVDHGRFKRIADRRSLRATAERYSLDGPFVLHTGALSARKNIPALVEAMGLVKQIARCSTHQLVLVGEETPGLPGRAAIAAAVELWGLEKDVRFLGHVPDEDLPALYNLAELVAMPSLYEGFGLPLLEAMACGTPVVACDSSSLPEVVGDAGVLVPPRDTHALAEAIGQVLTDTTMRGRLIERGLERAAKFTWERAAQETAQAYHQVLASSFPQGSAVYEAREARCLPR